MPLLPDLLDILVPADRVELILSLINAVPREEHPETAAVSNVAIDSHQAGDELSDCDYAIWYIRTGKEPVEKEAQRYYDIMVYLPIWRICLIRLAKQVKRLRERTKTLLGR